MLSGIPVGDCLRVLINLLKRNQSNQSLFIESGHLHRVVPLFEFLHASASESGSLSFSTPEAHSLSATATARSPHAPHEAMDADGDDEDDARGVPIHSFHQSQSQSAASSGALNRAALANGGGGFGFGAAVSAPEWPLQKLRNVLLTLHAVRALLSPSNQENTLRTAQLAVHQCGTCSSYT